MHDRHPQSAPGPFYVVYSECMACGAPEVEAEGLMTHGPDDSQCYFVRQPSTPDEVDHAILATLASCCGAIRYGGNDSEILTRFSEFGAADTCDQRPMHAAPLNLRDVARFEYTAPTFENGARILLHELTDESKSKYMDIVDYAYGADKAACTKVWGIYSGNEKGHRIRIAIERVGISEWQLTLSDNPVATGGTAAQLDKLLRRNPYIRAIRWYATEKSQLIESSCRPRPY